MKQLRFFKNNQWNRIYKIIFCQKPLNNKENLKEIQNCLIIDMIAELI